MSVVIRAENLYKEYKLGSMGHRLLYRDLQSWWARMRKKEDPNSQLLWDGTVSEKKNGKFLALKDVSFEINQGEIIGIIGRNGAGKSTLLKILSRVTAPTSGCVKMKGRIASLLEVGTGFHPELSGRENIFLNGAILGMSKSEIRKKFDEIVQFAEVEKFLDTPVKRYSSGMYVRLAFAVAAHLESDILIVDEVLAVGDAQFQKKCLSKMENVSNNGKTVLLVSHNMGTIHSLCSRCLLLNKGQIIADGSPEDVINIYSSQGLIQRPEFVQKHNPKKPMSFRRVYLQNTEDEIINEFRYDKGFSVVVEYEITQPVDDCCVWLGIRTAQDAVAFDTADTDVDGLRLGRREPGYYKATIRFPEKWLNAGHYYLIAGIERYSPQITYDRISVSSFTVLDIGTPEKLRTGYSRPGVLQPFIDWPTEKCIGD